MSWRDLVTAAFLCFLATCCNKPGVGVGTGGPGSSSVARSVDVPPTTGPFLVVAMNPQSWDAFRKEVQPLLPETGWLKQLFDGATPAAGLEAAFGLPDQLLTAQDDHIDDRRSVVVALARPPTYGGVYEAARLALHGGDHVPGLRHRIWIPARDPLQLARRLDAAFGNRLRPVAGLVLSRPTRQAYALSGDGDLIALAAESDSVRIDLITGDLSVRESPAKRLDRLREMLAAPDARELSMLETLHAAATPQTPLAVLVDPEALREVAVWRDLHEGRQYLLPFGHDDRVPVYGGGDSVVEPGDLAKITVELLDEALASRIVMTPAGQQIDLIAARLWWREGLRIEIAAVLTTLGKEALAAGLAGAGNPYQPSDTTDAMMRAEIAIDLGAMMRATRLPAWLRSSPEESTHVLREYSWRFWPRLRVYHLLLGGTWFLDLMLRSERITEDDLPKTASILLFDAPGEGVSAEVTATFPSTAAAASARAWLSGRDGTVVADALAGSPTTVVTFVGRPPDGQHFEKPRTVRGGQFLHFRVDATRLAPKIENAAPAVAALLANLGEIDGQLRMTNDMLVGVIMVAPTSRSGAAAAPVAALVLPQPSGDHSPPSDARGCLFKASSALAFVWGGSANGRNEDWPWLIDQALEGTREQISCALADPGTRAEAKEIDELLRLYIAWMRERLASDAKSSDDRDSDSGGP